MPKIFGKFFIFSQEVPNLFHPLLQHSKSPVSRLLIISDKANWFQKTITRKIIAQKAINANVTGLEGIFITPVSIPMAFSG